MIFPQIKRKVLFLYILFVLMLTGLFIIVTRHFYDDIQRASDQMRGIQVISKLFKFQEKLQGIRTLEQKSRLWNENTQAIARTECQAMLTQLDNFIETSPLSLFDITHNLKSVLKADIEFSDDSSNTPINHFNRHTAQIDTFIESIYKTYQNSRLIFENDFNAYLYSSFLSVKIPRITGSLSKVQGLLNAYNANFQQRYIYNLKLEEELVFLDNFLLRSTNEIRLIPTQSRMEIELFIKEFDSISSRMNNYLDKINKSLKSGNNIETVSPEGDQLLKDISELQNHLVMKILDLTSREFFNSVTIFSLFIFLSLSLIVIFFITIWKSYAETVKYQRLNNAISRSRQILILENNPPRIFDNVCECLASAGYQLVWIGLALNDDDKTVLPVAYKGVAENYMDKFQVRWGDDELGNGPVGNAIKRNQNVVFSDITKNPDFLPWEKRADNFNILSVAALPMNFEGKTIGVLCLYSAQRNGFPKRELELFQELINDLMFNLSVMRFKNQRNIAWTKLEFSNHNLKKKVLEKTKRIIEIQDSTIFSLGTLVEARDKETANHLIRTREYIRIMLGVMREDKRFKHKLNAENVEYICRSAPLHDIGKVAVPDHILGKAGKLTEKEFELMKMHTITGAQTIKSATAHLVDPGFLATAGDIVRHHHEKWDGTGYPDQLQGKNIPLSARVMAVADVYDALISRRPYKDPFPHDLSVKMINELSGSTFDPDLVDIFMQVHDCFRETSQTYQDEFST